MGQPRPGRRKTVVISSDEEDHGSPVVEDILTDTDDGERPGEKFDEEQLSSRSKRAAKRATSGHPTNQKATSKTTPAPSHSQSTSLEGKAKAKTRTKPKAAPAAAAPEPKRANKSIYSFFNAATQRQQSQTPSTSSQPPRASQDNLPEDILDDISGDEAPVAFAKTSRTTLAVKKRKLKDGPSETSVDDIAAPPATQKFRKVSDGSKVPSNSVTEDLRSWTERFPPSDLSELAVHKKKVQDVRGVLETALSSRASPRLIVLKGPAGCAKTATVNLLAKNLGVEIVEWKNPAGAKDSSGTYVSVSAQFEEFVLRSGQYAGLQLATSDGTTAVASVSNVHDEAPQIMLVEEFPNTAGRSSTALQAFRSTVQQFLAMPRLSSTKPTPLVMIISEALLSSNTSSADSFTAHRLLGPQILNHPQTTVIEFNPVAVTYLTKALDQIVIKEARRSGRRRTPGPQVLKHIAETGDIRSAVSSLEFLCVRGDEDDMWSARVAFTKPKGGKKDAPPTKQEREALKLISNRESSLGIFHAVGRVVYNKRQDPERPAPQPPNHLPQHRRPKVPEADVDVLINELGTDTGTFVAALHENYALSCNSTTGEDALDSLNGCIDALSDSDLLSLDRFGFGTRAYSGSAQDNLRQDDMSFQAAVRGILLSLPSPVNRGGSGGAGGRRSDAFKMFYPASLKIWKRREELEGTLDLVVQSLQHGSIGSIAPQAKTGKKEGVESWRRNTDSLASTAAVDTDASDESPTLLSVINSSAKSELLLDRLPYTAQILSKRPNISSSLLSNISTLTSLPSDVENTADLEDPAEDETRDPAGDDPEGEGEGESRSRRRAQRGAAVGRDTKKRETEGGGLHIPIEHAVEKLVLSDDDIEDD